MKAEREWVYSNLLIKDANNVYWDLGIAHILSQNFVDVLNNKADEKTIAYCEDMSKAYQNLDLEKFFNKKINEQRYFNKCELKYISLYFPAIYNKALESREHFVQEKEKAEELKRISKCVKAGKYLCQLTTLKFQQMDGLNTVLPSGTKRIKTNRAINSNRYVSNT